MTRPDAAPDGVQPLATLTPPATGSPAAPSPAPAVPATQTAPAKQVTCPVCRTRFAPRATAGHCPVCGEAVVPAEQAARALPGVSGVRRWLFDEGNWRVAAIVFLVLYQVALFIALWIHLARIHAL